MMLHSEILFIWTISCLALGCDSCDGSSMARFPTKNLLPMVRALHADNITETKQLQLWQN